MGVAPARVPFSLVGNWPVVRFLPRTEERELEAVFSRPAFWNRRERYTFTVPSEIMRVVAILFVFQAAQESRLTS